MRGKAWLLALLFVTSMVSGCFGPKDDDNLNADDLLIGIENLQGGVFQNVLFTAKDDLSVFIPYLIPSLKHSYCTDLKKKEVFYLINLSVDQSLSCSKKLCFYYY